MEVRVVHSLNHYDLLASHEQAARALTGGFSTTKGDGESIKKEKALKAPLATTEREELGLPPRAGCAAVSLVILGGTLWCANCGDSRAVLCRDGKAIQLSLDHKPDRPDELRRIESAGGFVSFRRVLGRLAVSRAFGDVEYKSSSEGLEPLVISEPEIRLEKLRSSDEFVILACDGLFDVFTSQEAVDFIRQKLADQPAHEQDPEKAVRDIVREAIVTRNSRDNVTVVLVVLKRTIKRNDAPNPVPTTISVDAPTEDEKAVI